MKIPTDTKPGLMPIRAAAGSCHDDPTPGPFIVTLCALPGLALPQLPAADLVGLRPFVSRRTGVGGERFYLHVGFFQTLGESETWLNTVRTTYPNAFASKLPDGPRSGEPAASVLADTQVLKVLQVRAPDWRVHRLSRQRMPVRTRYGLRRACWERRQARQPSWHCRSHLRLRSRNPNRRELRTPCPTT
jgi:hypothetical protein